ncbi:kinase-like domain-containing protein [Favolaschia claudopus]|uniref:Kinase-like domain-containing protein n=1 Tax=Favolaschia claudopus TaxID=2862362 RepID=A0AAW0CTY3_9AGAR
MIADFGLSRIMDEERMTLLTEVCGTVGYMAPEVFRDGGCPIYPPPPSKRSGSLNGRAKFTVGYGMPVDIWAMGVITYFLLAGYTPFDRDTSAAAIAAIVARDLKFEPTKYWANVSPTARELVQACLTVDPVTRPTAAEALEHKWLTAATPHFLPDPLNPTGGPTSLLPHVKRAFNTKSASCDLSKHVLKLREESAREVLEATHHHNMQGH